MMSKYVLLLVLVVLAVGMIACGEDPSQSLTGGATEDPYKGKSVTDWPAEAQPLVDLATTEAAKLAQVKPEEVRVVGVESVQWRDSCLGCDESQCAQVVTPGYRVVLQAGDETYEYHTDTVGKVVTCSTDAQPRSYGQAQPLVDKALEDMAGRLSVSKEDIVVVQVEHRMWSDSSLGCPQPGMMYLQVVTPGYQIILEAEGQQYDYHADETAKVLLCQQKQ